MHRRRLHLRFHVLVDHLGTRFDVLAGEFIGHRWNELRHIAPLYLRCCAFPRKKANIL